MHACIDVPQEDEASADDDEEDRWNTIFKSKKGDTIRSIAAELNIPVAEIQAKNYDLPGSCPRTGVTNPDQELLPGTGLWTRDPEGANTPPALLRLGAALAAMA